MRARSGAAASCRARLARVAALGGAGAIAMLGLSACVSSVADPVPSQSGSTAVAVPAGGTAAASSTPQSPQATAPLTGLPVSPAVADRPAIALDVAGSHPRGLSDADLVYEEITTPTPRYIAVFQSAQAPVVGPITGTRPVDGMALSVLHPLIGYDGGTVGFLAVLRLSKVTDVGYAAKSSLYGSGPGGPTTSTMAIWRSAEGTPPPPIFQFRGTDGSNALAANGQRQGITAVRVTIPGGGTQSWTFDPGDDRWAEASGGPRAWVSNLVIQMVSYKQVFLSRKLRITAPSARVIGTGRVLVLTGHADTTASGGLAAAGTWSKPGTNALTNYLDDKGFPMSLQPGPTWVILAPPGTGVRVDTGTS